MSKKIDIFHNRDKGNRFLIILSLFLSSSLSSVFGAFSGVSLPKRENEAEAIKTSIISKTSYNNKTIIAGSPTSDTPLETKRNSLENYSNAFATSLYENHWNITIHGFYEYANSSDGQFINFSPFFKNSAYPKFLNSMFLTAYESYLGFTFFDDDVGKFYFLEENALTNQGIYSFAVSQTLADEMIGYKGSSWNDYKSIIGKQISLETSLGNPLTFRLISVVKSDAVTEYYEKWFGPFVIVGKPVAQKLTDGYLCVETTGSAKANQKIFSKAKEFNLFDGLSMSFFKYNTASSSIEDITPYYLSSLSGPSSSQTIVGFVFLSLCLLLLAVSLLLWFFLIKHNKTSYPRKYFFVISFCVLLFSVSLTYVASIIVDISFALQKDFFLFSQYAFGMYLCLGISLLLFLVPLCYSLVSLIRRKAL